VALELGAAPGLLEAPEQRLVAALGVQVQADHEHGPAAEAELADERLAARAPDRALGLDPARARAEPRVVAPARSG